MFKLIAVSLINLSVFQTEILRGSGIDDGVDRNLAINSYGAEVITSSFANTDSLYSDNLIDGDAATSWEAFDSSLPQWIELSWPNTVTLNRVVLHPVNPSVLQDWQVEQWQGNEWKKLGEGKEQAVHFPPVALRRLRIVITEASGLPLQLSSIEAFGPPQPIVESLRPYWRADYIWYPEADQRLQIEKPRFFRKTFEIKELESVTNAFLQSRSNDQYTAYINGKSVDSGSVAVHAVPVKEFLHAGKNILAYEAVAHSDPGWGSMELIGELTVNTKSGPIDIGTDETWKSNGDEMSGWNSEAFNDSSWSNASVIGKPPQGPWGEINFNPVAEGESIRLIKSSFEPKIAHPGETIKAKFTFISDHTLQNDYILEFRLGEKEINHERQDFRVVSGILKADSPMDTWRPGEAYVAELSFTLPPYAPAGKVPWQLSGLATDGSGRLLNIADPDPKLLPDALTIERKAEPLDSKIPDVFFNQPSLHVGNKTFPPLFWALQSSSYEKYRKYAQAGPHIFRLEMHPYIIEPETDYSYPHLAYLDQQISNLLKTVPDAQVIVFLDLRASANWRNKHPNACLRDAFGNRYGESMLSGEYQDAVVYCLRQVIKFLQSKPYASRIIGYMPYIGPEVESCIGGVDINAGVIDRSKWTIGDWSPEAVQAFRGFLRNKYSNNVTALRASWKDDSVDFKSAQPDRNKLIAASPDNNLFSNPQAGRMRADYFEFLSSIVPTVFEEKVAKVIKTLTHGKALVGCYYGYVLEELRGVNPPGTVQQNNHFWLQHLIDSPYIDFFASPLNYEYSRLAGTRFFPFQPYASIGLHKKLYVAELDHRTFVSGLKTYGRQRSQEETIAVLERDLGTTLIGHSGAWFADWSTGRGRSAHGFFLDDEILKTISTAYQIETKEARITASTGGIIPHNVTQIAVIISPETPWHQDVAYPSIIYNTLICHMVYQELATIGTPFDILMIDDLKDPKVRQQYKLFIMLNPFYLTNQQKLWIEDLKNGGRSLLWFYAPGYVSDEYGLSVEQISKVTGMQVELLTERQIPAFNTTGDSAILEGTPNGTEVTIDPYDNELNFSTIMPTKIFPNFMISDPKSVVLGKDDKGNVRFAMKEFGTWTSIYSTVPNMPQNILRNIAQFAGVHLYTETGTIVEANDRYLMVHYGGQIPRNIAVTLPQKSDVLDLYSNEVVAKNKTSFEFISPKIGTRVFQLSKP